MTYQEDLKRLHEARIDALENRVEELEIKLGIETNKNYENR